MREKFDSEIVKAVEKSYNKKLSSRMLDDLGTAFISAPEHGHLDDSLKAVKSTRHALAREGYSIAEIDDYLLEHSYLSKTQIRHLRNRSIYVDDSISLIPMIEQRIASHSDRCTTDILIDVIKSKPLLLSGLQRGINKSNLSRTHGVNQPTVLIDFYNKYKEFIDN